MHNLFGRMDEAHVIVDPDEESGWYIDETIEGDTIREVWRRTSTRPRNWCVP
jgi:arginine decarboxylase